MSILWQWLTGGWRYFRPWWCKDCGRWALVFRIRDGDEGRCERCWLALK